MNEKQKRNIERTVSKFETALGLGFVAIQNTFSDEEVEHTAEVITNWEYREAAIIWYTKNCENLTQEELEEVVIHELGHIIVAPMSDHLPKKHRKLEEFVVSSITRAIINSRKKT